MSRGAVAVGLRGITKFPVRFFFLSSEIVAYRVKVIIKPFPVSAAKRTDNEYMQTACHCPLSAMTREICLVPYQITGLRRHRLQRNQKDHKEFYGFRNGRTVDIATAAVRKICRVLQGDLQRGMFTCQFTMLVFICTFGSPHRISRRRPFDPSTGSRTKSSGTGSASATPPQGGSD